MMHVTIVASPAEPAVFETVWPDELACARAANAWAETLRGVLAQGASVVIQLHGTLGAGKTTFTRHLLRAMGVQGRIKSPSYAVVEPHETPVGTVHHFDFYRFNDPAEWEDAGFRDVFAAPGLKLVEWPEKAAGMLPMADVDLTLTPDGATSGAGVPGTGDAAGDEWRQVRLMARSATGLAMLQAWQDKEVSHV